jgi:hypothetical protein
MKMSKRLFVLAGFCLWTVVVAIASYSAGAKKTNSADWDPRIVISSLRVGDEIASAIGKYREDQGRYPERLYLLIPKYLKSIEPPSAGTRVWNYTTDEKGTQYALELDSRAPYQFYWRNSFSDKWMYQGPDLEY